MIRKSPRTPIIAIVTMCLTLPACTRDDPSDTAPKLPGDGPTSKYNVIDTRTDQVDLARAKQNVEDTLTKYPQIDCLVGLWAYNGPAILSAVKDAGLHGKVIIVCFDEEVDVLRGIIDGHIEGTIVQQPYEFGYQCVRMLASVARGDRSVIPEDRVMEVPVKVIESAPDASAYLKHLATLQEDFDAAGVAPADADVMPVRLSFISNAAADFWRYAQVGVRHAEREFNAECDFHMPTGDPAAEQRRFVETAIARKLDGLAISPIDSANQIGMINEAAKVMPVFCHDSDAADSDRMCYVGTNNYKAGHEAGKLIKQALPDGGDIMIFVGKLDAQNAIERRQGIIDELNDVPMP